jgi:hypothetical protein
MFFSLYVLFPQLKLCINFGQNGFGHILGDYFINSSGHLATSPATKERQRGLDVRQQFCATNRLALRKQLLDNVQQLYHTPILHGATGPEEN